MSNSWETCCICVEKCLYAENIKENDRNNVKYIDKLKLCVPNEEWNDDFVVCNDCIEKLDAAYEFVQVCIKSETYRREQIKIKEEAKLLIVKDEFKCEICYKTFKLKRTLALHNTRVHVRKKLKEAEGVPLQRKSDEIKEDVEIKPEYVDEKEDLFSGDGFQENCGYIDEIDRNSTCSSDDDVKPKKKPLKRGTRKKPRLLKKCEYCDLTFLRTDKFAAHIRSKHTFEKPYKCDLCPSKYYSAHNLAIHKRKHTSEKPYVCSICGKKFISSNDLWQHNKIHNATREYVCDVCDRRYKTHSNLRTHKVQMHLDPSEWKFVCSTCGKKFPLKNNLLKHMRRHAGIKSFACHLCPKAFVEKIDLQTHLLSHSDERLFKCTLCVKEYKKKGTLRNHMKVEHDVGTVQIKKPEKKLACPMCPKLFAFNNKLRRHILTHTGEKPVDCRYCEKKFRDNYDRNLHLKKEHEVESAKEAMYVQDEKVQVF